MDIERAFEVLEINKDSTPQEIKRNYRKLAAIWHPDLHGNDPKQQKIASEKMKELNVAYDVINQYFIFLEKRYSEDTRHPESDVSIIICPGCGVKNRLRDYYDIEKIKCGRCGSILFESTTYYNDENLSDRILCGDDTCIGTVQKDGRCNYCGRSYQNAKEESEYQDRILKERMQKRKKKDKNRQIIKISIYSIGILGIVLFIFLLDMMVPETDYNDLNNISRRQPIIKTKPLKKKSVEIENHKISIFFTKRKQNQVAELDIISYIEDNILSADLSDIASEGLQQHLNVLGYGPLTVDGIIGLQTVSAIQDFCDDFGTHGGSVYFNNLLEFISFHAFMKTYYSQWSTIYQNGEFLSWLALKPNNYINQLIHYINSQKASRYVIVKNLLCQYRFAKERPPALSLPANGVINQAFQNGIAPLKITTKQLDNHHYIKLINTSDQSETLTAFIRSGTSISLGVPLGEYEIKSAAGKTWYGDIFYFGPRSVFTKLDKTFIFKVDGQKVSGYTIELFLQPYGNLSMDDIPAFAF